MSDARQHIEEAFHLLNGVCFRLDEDGSETHVQQFCTIVTDLRRIDAAIGVAGASAFARMADTIEAVFVEIIAARKALEGKS